MFMEHMEATHAAGQGSGDCQWPRGRDASGIDGWRAVGRHRVAARSVGAANLRQYDIERQ
jgi:hypothetical protein